MAEKALPEERSYGVIPFRRNGAEWDVLLIRHHSGHWSFPKGRAEKGESELEAARREFEEETGITDYRIDAGAVFKESYRIRRDREMSKTVAYFVGIVNKAEVRIQAEEISEYKWVRAAEAEAQITYPEARRILADARRHLEKHCA